MITIIGAGIGGLTTALAFEKLGIEYHVYEKAPELKEIGAGIWMPPNALQVIEWINPSILKDLQLHGNSIDRITLADLQLNPISDTDQNFAKEQFGFSTIAIHRGKLQYLLLKNIPKEKITMGKAFKSYTSLSDQKIEIVFEDGTQTTTTYLIGSDGIHSKIRHQLFPKSRLRYSGQTCWRGVAAYEMNPTFDHNGIEMWGNQLRFGISRLQKNQVYWFAVALSEPNLKDDTVFLKDKLIDLFSDFHEEVIQLIKHTPTDKIIRTDLNDLKILKTWYHHNICLIGDAAHGMTPNLGQGGSQAIEDAYYLSNLIASQKDIIQAFSEFYRLRSKKVNSIVSQSWNMGKIGNMRYGSRIRNFMLKNVPSSKLKKQMISLYSIDKTISNK
ncbi:FAD-dependent monooxygenase [Aquimarina algiphila]|uniref:FAD-dependent monooxygenase n=1 Tax=Aquimarina algiphila TaxID=2047982 RepID=UPI00232FB644|nr:FAD-dependent monooxygenase [Aquimarina algiphila]